MKDWTAKLKDGYKLFTKEITALFSAREVLISDAIIPTDPGVYMFLMEKEVMYVGEAKGSGGLRDRIVRKHLSGDDSHVLQRAYRNEYPDRETRREFLRSNIHAKWVVIHDTSRIPIVERIAIWLLKPRWNRA